MFMVMCKADKRGRKWNEYSAEVFTVQEAEAIKAHAESIRALSVDGLHIVYKIVKSPAKCANT